MKFAHIQNNIAQEIIDFDPVGRFHPDVAAQFTVCPDNVTAGSTHNADGTWTIYVAPVVVAPVVVVVPPKVTPIQYKLLFAIGERIAIATAKASDPVLQDLYGILDDPRLTEVDLALQSTQDALMYIESKGLITNARRLEILTGQLK